MMQHKLGRGDTEQRSERALGPLLEELIFLRVSNIDL